MATTLQDLITQANEIKRGISVINDDSVLSYYTNYEFQDSSQYETWKYMAIRHLHSNFKGDKSVSDFEAKIVIFENNGNAPAKFDALIGILKSCEIYGRIEPEETKVSAPLVSISNNNNNLSQSQEQITNITIEIFIEAIKDEIKGKELKALRSIVEENKGDIEKAKPAILDKIKSFGEATMTNIIANIITNPSIWKFLENSNSI